MATPTSLLFPFNSTSSLRYYRFARSAIFNGLKAAGLGPAHRVLMPEYHHGVEVETVRLLGAHIDYYPVDLSLSVNPSQIENAIRPETRALYVIHYFGFPQPIMQLREICTRRGLLLFEDCALSLFSGFQKIPLGSLGDMSAFCLYKYLPIPDGGVLAINNTSWEKGVRSIPHIPIPFHMETRRVMAELYATTRRLIQRNQSPGNNQDSSPAELRCDQHLQAEQAVPPAQSEEMRTASDSPPEQAGHPWLNPSAQFNWAISPISLLQLIKLDGIKVRERRRENYQFWQRAMESLTCRNPQGPADRLLSVPFAQLFDEDTCPMLFPVLIKDKEAICSRMLSLGLPLHNWWNRHYGGAEPGLFPVADLLKRHLVGLPVNQMYVPADLERFMIHLRELL